MEVVARVEGDDCEARVDKLNGEYIGEGGGVCFSFPASDFLASSIRLLSMSTPTMCLHPNLKAIIKINIVLELKQ